MVSLSLVNARPINSCVVPECDVMLLYCVGFYPRLYKLCYSIDASFVNKANTAHNYCCGVSVLSVKQRHFYACAVWIVDFWAYAVSGGHNLQWLSVGKRFVSFVLLIIKNLILLFTCLWCYFCVLRVCKQVRCMRITRCYCSTVLCVSYNIKQPN